MKAISSRLYLFLASLFLSVNLSAQSFIDTSKVWNVYTCSGMSVDVCNTFTYQFRSDTLINSVLYYEMFVSSDSIPLNWWSGGLYREDTLTKKVYRYENGNEDLLYDFNLNVGDTAYVISYNGPSCIAMVVDSIKFNVYSGVTRKQWHFNTIGLDGYGTETWIEGIGNQFGPTMNLVLTCWANYKPTLICYKENNQMKYFDTDFNDCYKTTTGISTRSSLSSTIIYPNPSRGEFTVSFSDEKERYIVIANSLGQVIETFYSERALFSFNVPGAGVYELIVHEDTTVWRHKLIRIE